MAYETDVYFYVAECESNMHISLRFSYYETLRLSYMEPPESESWEPVSFKLLALENEKYEERYEFDPPIDMTDFFSSLLENDTEFDAFLSKKVFEYIEKLKEEMLT